MVVIGLVFIIGIVNFVLGFAAAAYWRKLTRGSPGSPHDGACTPSAAAPSGPSPPFADP